MTDLQGVLLKRRNKKKVSTKRVNINR